ncbi:MAG: DUF6880 family protein [bacterium]
MTLHNKHIQMEVLTRKALKQIAGERSFGRGEDYFSNGQVYAMVEYEGKITAKVRGTSEYRVKLWVADKELNYSCNCPVGAGGEFCKHCVAIGLAYLDQQKNGGAVLQKSKKPSVTMDDIRNYLETRDKKTLLDMLMKQVFDDDRLREQLLMKAAKKGNKGIDLAAFRAVINSAVRVDDFVDYNSVYNYTNGIDNVVDSIEDLLKEGYVSEVIELSEYALESVEEAMSFVDDSDGNMGDILGKLQEIHHSACKKAKPDPEIMAKKLFEWELRAEYDVFYGAVSTYADVLGEKGLAVYRKLAEDEWAKIPPLRPNEEDPEKYGRRFRITSIMEALAKESGDLEALVKIKSKDLSDAYSFLQIAELYKKARKYDLALEWAERGVKAFPNRTDSRLRGFLAEEYHRRKRHDDAMALIWVEFTNSPYLEQYKNLKVHSERINKWLIWREKALACLQEKITKTKREETKNQRRLWPETDNSELVKIFLWEKDIESAWRKAKEGGCANSLWLILAVEREKGHPEDSLVIYRQQIEPALSRKDNEAYKETINFLRKIRSLLIRLGRKTEFKQYVESIRTAHKPKRNFMKLLEKENWL